MASLNEICSALSKTISTYSTSPVFAYDTVSDMVNFPAIMVMPQTGDFAVAMGGKVTEWALNVFVLCAKSGDDTLAAKQLNNMIDGWGTNSIRQILFEHDDLDLGDGTDVMALQVGAYGGAFESGTVAAVGAIVHVRVLTDSTVSVMPLSDSDSASGVGEGHAS